MCSFWLTTLLISLQAQLDEINHHAVTRGPDLTVGLEYQGFTFVHNLLAITTAAGQRGTASSSPTTSRLAETESGSSTSSGNIADGTSGTEQPPPPPVSSYPQGVKQLLRRANRAANSIEPEFADANGQPIFYEDAVLLFNGEIYNYRELLYEHELPNPGATEGQVLVQLYRKLGPDFVKQLDGEFALAIVDFRLLQTVFATDVFGTKPLWFAVGRGATRTGGAKAGESGERKSAGGETRTRSRTTLSTRPSIHIATYRSVLLRLIEQRRADAVESHSSSQEIEDAKSSGAGTSGSGTRTSGEGGKEDADSPDDELHGDGLGQVVDFQESDIQHAEPNRVVTCPFTATADSFQTLCTFSTVKEFDLRQHKSDSSDFDAAFERAVYKRVHGPPGSRFIRVFMGLSTGYDSGAIHLALGKMQRLEGVTKDTGNANDFGKQVKIKSTKDVDAAQTKSSSAGGTAASSRASKEERESSSPSISTNSAGIAATSSVLAGGKIFPNGKQRERLQGDDFVAYVIVDAAFRETLKQRIAYNNVNVKLISKTWQNFKKELTTLQQKTEEYFYDGGNWAGKSLQQDASAAPGISLLTKLAAEDGRRVYLSGSGADEIISDYGFNGTKFFPHSSFGGRFPPDLSSVFPWASFFLGTMRDYLMKDEIIAGFHGIEGRYPFLDFEVVQEFLWLQDSVKNSQYKSALARYLQKHAYPIAFGKQGFGASTDLKVYDPPNGQNLVHPGAGAVVELERVTAADERERDTAAGESTSSSSTSANIQADDAPTGTGSTAEMLLDPATTSATATKPPTGDGAVTSTFLQPPPQCGENMYFVALRSRLTARVLDGEEFGCANENIKRDRENLVYILWHDLQNMVTNLFGEKRFKQECAIGFFTARLLKTVSLVDKNMLGSLGEQHDRSSPTPHRVDDKTTAATRTSSSTFWDGLHIEMPDFRLKHVHFGNEERFVAVIEGKQLMDSNEIWHHDQLGVRLPPLVAEGGRRRRRNDDDDRPGFMFFHRNHHADVVGERDSHKNSWSSICTSGFPVFRVLLRLPQLYASGQMMDHDSTSSTDSDSEELYQLFVGKFEAFLAQELLQHVGTTSSEVRTIISNADGGYRYLLAELLHKFDSVFESWIQQNEENLAQIPSVADAVDTVRRLTTSSRLCAREERRNQNTMDEWKTAGENHEERRTSGQPSTEEQQDRANSMRSFDPVYYLFWMNTRSQIFLSEFETADADVHGVDTMLTGAGPSSAGTPFLLNAVEFSLEILDFVQTISNSWVSLSRANQIVSFCNQFLHINYADGTWCDGY
ncbi:unnamed protein product [Amoebophrya sp. A120]|nr:unnamed protein product [Amoebophrya sp. A120]|eukprot:GSA120T00022133001.1